MQLQCVCICSLQFPKKAAEKSTKPGPQKYVRQWPQTVHKRAQQPIILYVQAGLIPARAVVPKPEHVSEAPGMEFNWGCTFNRAQNQQVRDLSGLLSLAGLPGQPAHSTWDVLTVTGRGSPRFSRNDGLGRGWATARPRHTFRDGLGVLFGRGLRSEDSQPG